MAYLIKQGGKTLDTVTSKADAQKAVTKAVNTWRRNTPGNTAVKRRDPDSPIGYRYALKYRTRPVNYVAVEQG